MPSRVVVQLLARPIPRSLAAQSRPALRTISPACPSSSRSAGRLSRPPSICLRCGIHRQIRSQSTTSGAPPPPPQQEPSQPPRPSSETASSPSSSSSTTNPTSSAESPGAQTPPDSDLPSFHESARSAAQARFSSFMDTLQSRLVTASQTLNDLTGYTAIEKIKQANEGLERELAAAQARLRSARQGYKTLNHHRAATQREVTTLLARKDTWTPGDLERFTALYRSDHELEAKVAAAGAELTEAEADEARLGAALNAGILRRYHEEQIWSDRIRRSSTWGTWGLMGVNVLLFIGLQFVAEPWKRKRLVDGFAEAESAVWDEVKREVGEVRTLLTEVREGGADKAQTGVVGVDGGEAETLGDLATINEEVAVGATAIPPIALGDTGKRGEWWREVILHPHTWPAVLEDLYSERRIDLRMRDASILALEGAVAGASVAAGVLFMILRRP